MATTLIRGGTVVNADLSERADVLIKDGKIVAVGEGLSGDTVIDVGAGTGILSMLAAASCAPPPRSPAPLQLPSPP